jgi:hypothetical protein
MSIPMDVNASRFVSGSEIYAIGGIMFPLAAFRQTLFRCACIFARAAKYPPAPRSVSIAAPQRRHPRKKAPEGACFPSHIRANQSFARST